MRCPFYTPQKHRFKKYHICMRYSSPHYRKECPYNGDLEVCKKEGGSADPPLRLPFEKG